MSERSIETSVGTEDGGPPQEHPFDEAVALYYGEWVLMKVLAVDEHDVPTRGIVVAHSPDRDAVSAAPRREPPCQPGAPYQPYHTFSAFPRVRPGETFEQALDRFAAERAAVEAARGD